MTTQEELSSLLRVRGLRITPQREKVLEIFYTLPEGEHLTAEDLYNILRKKSEDISLATSYRTLKLFASLGVLRELDFAEDHKHYELARTGPEGQHQHIICIECGYTDEFTSPEVFDESTAIAKASNFELVDVQLKLFGRCLECQQGKKVTSKRSHYSNSLA